MPFKGRMMKVAEAAERGARNSGSNDTLNAKASHKHGLDP
jgi:hypothetical protein